MVGQPRTLDLPVAVNESISLELDPLPPADDIQVFLEALVYERPPSKYWTRLASQLWFENRADEARQVCTQGVQVLAPYKPAEAVPLYGLLSAFGLSQASTAPKQVLPDAKYQRLAGQRNKDALYREANATIARAHQTDPQHHVNQLSRGIAATANADNDAALRTFDAILAKHPRHAIALLGKACILLRKRQYAPALKIYQQVLEISLVIQSHADKDEHSNILGWRGPDPRVGIGLCLWGLGHHDAARKAWKRAVQLNKANAPAHLLLGISSLNVAKQTAKLVPGTFGAHVERSEDEARQLAYTEGMQSLQESWKLEKRNAMTAIAMSDFFTSKASQAEMSAAATAAGGTANDAASIQAYQAAMGHYTTALKLAEHAIQYADSRSAVMHANLAFARASHLASHLPIASAKIELRLQAQKSYSRVVDDLAKTPSAASAALNGQMPPGLALATLGLAQCYVANRDPLAAINALDNLTNRPSAIASVTPMIELSLLAASLRVKSTPGATPSERRADAERARIMLDRALRLIEAAKVEAYGESAQTQDPDEFPSSSPAAKGENPGDASGPLGKALLTIRTEDLSKAALEAIASLGSDPLTRVEFAKTLQFEDLARTATAFSESLEVVRSRIAGSSSGKTDDSAADASLVASLETCLGAVLAIRAGDIPDNDANRSEERSWLLSRAAMRLESAISGAVAAVPADASGQVRAEIQRAVDAVKLVASYNFGRVNEAIGNVDMARQAYEALLNAHPEYVDAKVRLAILNVSRAPAPGPDAAPQFKAQRDAANALFKEALASDPGNLDTRATYVCFLAGEFPGNPVPAWAAIKDFTAQLFAGPSDAASKAVFGSATAAKAAADEGRRDAHTLASLGWTYYQLAIHATGSNAKAERGKGMMRATDLMDKALQSDPRCAFAAQAMAILLAEDAFAETAGGVSQTLPAALGGAPEERRKRNADEAIAILSKLREVRDAPSVHVCTGHALMQKEEYERALRAYETALKRFSDGSGNAMIRQCIARAEYAVGMKSKQFASLKSSMANLERARELVSHERGKGHPECRQIEYNYAVTAQKALQMLFDLPKDRKSAADLRDAVRAVEKVQPLLTAPAEGAEPVESEFGKQGALLEAAKRGHLLWISVDIVEQRGKYGASSLLQRATQVVADQERHEEEIRAQREAVFAARKEKEVLREQERIRKEEEYRQQIEQMAEKRRAMREEAAKIEYVRETTPDKEPRRRAQKRGDVTSGEEDAPDAEREKGRKRKRGGAAGSRGGGKKKGGKKQKNLDTAESDEDDDDDNNSDDDEGLFGGGGSGSDSSDDNNDEEDGDEEIIRNGVELLAAEGDEGSTRRGKSLAKLSKSKKQKKSKSSSSASRDKDGGSKRRKKLLKRASRASAAAAATADSDEDDGGNEDGAEDGDEGEQRSQRRSRRKDVFAESSDEDGADNDDQDEAPKKASSQKRTKKARVTNDIIDSDEEMALLDD
ncbi:hypothetical protein BCV70DRAFT_199601 [Testicularia cyperi]|uniref:TPR-like protein n=1 Tax=Testicularia cyperi TaxID=1882483 RepID=A0A317XTX2_9BASI|nr:hypothetical protein BCV70DRAFT_199601 [Testicularia cyperi]